MYTPSPLLAPLLYLPGLAYESIIRFRNRLYSLQRLPSRRLRSPVISIGNITLGGTGKTPLVILIAKILRQMGFSPALLSRGYGRSEPGKTIILGPGEAGFHSAAVLGDEPALIRRIVPEIWLGISAEKYHAGYRIESMRHNVVFILDDGYQHRQLARTLDLVVIDLSQPLRTNRVFPRGSLREPLSGLKRADAIILHGTQEPCESDNACDFLRNINSAANVFHCEQTIEALVPLRTWASGSHSIPSPIPEKRVVLVSAIGNPRRFERDMAKLRVVIKATRFFRDHHGLHSQDWQACIEEARRVGAEAIVVTEKDAVKIDECPAFPLLVACQKVLLRERPDFERFLSSAIIEAVK